MATTSSFGDRRSRVSFDRVELDQPGIGDRAFELSEAIEIVGKELSSVTWVYDPTKDVVVWSSPIERLFEFEEGIRGFSVLADDPTVAGSSVAADEDRQDGSPDDDPDQSCAPPRFADGADFGDSLLAPILAPIRHGVPPSEFDLHREVHCPDGVIHHVVVRASPMPAPGVRPSSPGTRSRPSTSAWLSTSPPNSDSSASSARWSTAIGCSPRSPPMWCSCIRTGASSTGTGPWGG